MKRVRRATLQREPYSLQHATEHRDRLRAIVLEILVKLSVRGKWQEVARQGMLHVQHSDCRSLTDHILSSTPKQVEDKRLSIVGARSTRWEDDTLGHEAFTPYAGVDICAFASG